MNGGRSKSGIGPEAAIAVELRLGGVTFGPADAALLVAVAEHGSLNAAAEALGRSYSRAHARIGELEDGAGPLLDRERGGSGGGGSVLTANARDLLARFHRLEAALEGTADAPETVLEGTVMERDGELATVETGAGTVRAVLFDPADRVQLSLRADAITLHEPESVPPENDTSARNRLRGEVREVDRREAIAEVSVDAGESTTLVALLTTESVGRLDLAPGKAVVASFKATATRATPLDGAESQTGDGA